MSATQPAVQPSGYIMHHKSKQRNCKDFIKPIPTTKTAKYDKSCIVHVINDKEMKTLTRQGVTFIHLKSPNRMDFNDVEIINWELDSPSIDSLSEIDLLKSKVMIVTKYHYIKDDQKLSFIGTIQKRIPEDNDIVLLALILQTELDDNQESVDVQSLCQQCDTTKWNINKGTSSNHFDSSGESFGFGARRSYRTTKNSPSTMGQFSFKTKKEQENFYLEKGIVDAMGQVTSVVENFMGYNLHNLNATHL